MYTTYMYIVNVRTFRRACMFLCMSVLSACMSNCICIHVCVSLYERMLLYVLIAYSPNVGTCACRPICNATGHLCYALSSYLLGGSLYSIHMIYTCMHVYNTCIVFTCTTLIPDVLQSN